MTVTFLGTGTSTGVPAIACKCDVCRSDDRRNKRTRTSAALRYEGHTVLIDASIDLRQQMLREEIDSLGAVLLTHSHADHVFGLDDIRMFNFIQRAPVPVYCSDRTVTDINRTFWYIFEPVPQITLHAVESPFDLFGARVIPLPVIHGNIPILGYRIGGFAYVTDASAIPDETLPLMTDLDVLVVNALRREPHPTHFNLEGALDAIRRIGPRRAFLTHISHGLDHEALSRELPDSIHPAHDGLTITLPDAP
jgi:phosphoribosyl 1,2-cyclic phosphate phosphodiesterase